MNATSPTVTEQVIPPVNPQEEHTYGPDCNHSEPNNIRYVTANVLKQIKKQRQHFERLQKKREERWQQPCADAKIEDLNMVYERCLTEIEILRRALIMKGILTKEDFLAAREFHSKRVQKAQELRANTEMSVEDKKQAATEFDIPFEAIGITEEQPQAETTAETTTE